MPKHKRDNVKRFQDSAIVALSADADDLQRLHSSSKVDYIVEDNINYPLALTPTVAKIGGNAGWTLGFTGAGQTVAVLDNGVNKNHPFLANKVVREACFQQKTNRKKLSRLVAKIKLKIKNLVLPALPVG